MTHYLIIGEDSRLKEQQIVALKQQFLPDPDSEKFDYDVLYASKLSLEDLKRTLFFLPVVAAQRLVILRNGEKLKQPHKELLKEFFESGQESTVLVLEAEWDQGDKYIQGIRPFVTVRHFPVPAGEDVFVMTRLLTSRRTAEALAALNRILEGGTHPLQIMGGLVWFWGNKARMMTDEIRFKKGLLFLQEADLNIKRSRLAPAHALEVLLSQLGMLLNG